MLFLRRMACFSPSVPRHFRVLWVQNQGMLTHSAQDFFKADYFFCDGLKDDWLEKLTAKGLIVHHPLWISNCVSNGFLMPISKYVLDDLFNPNGIYKDPVFDPKTRTRKDPKPLPACSPPSSSSFSRRSNQKHPFEQSSPIDPYPRKRPRVSYGTEYESITLVQDDTNVDTEGEEDDSRSLSFDENSPSSKQSMLAELRLKKSNTVFRTPLSSSRPHSESSRQRPIMSSPMTRDSVNSKTSSTRRPDPRPCPSVALKHSILQDEEGEMNKPIPDVELKTKHKHKSYFEGKVIRFADPVTKSGSDKHSSSRYPGRELDLETLDTKPKEAQCMQEYDAYRDLWKDLRKQSISMSTRGDTLTFSVQDLLRVPRAEVTFFEAGVEYEGEVFAVRQI